MSAVVFRFSHLLYILKLVAGAIEGHDPCEEALFCKNTLCCYSISL